MDILMWGRTVPIIIMQSLSTNVRQSAKTVQGGLTVVGSLVRNDFLRKMTDSRSSTHQ